MTPVTLTYPRIIGHRGGGALAPENTLVGFHVAARLGCRGVEFDAMLTADGVPVLIHDETLERTTSGQGWVSDISAKDFALLDAGGKHHRAFSPAPPPTLMQALQVCAELGLWVNVEIKPATGFDAETGTAVAADCAQARGALVLSSFSAEALRAAAHKAPALPRAFLVGEIPADWQQLISDLNATALHTSARALTTNPDLFARVCRSGLPIACYTVNRRRDAENLFAAGVSAIFTDRLDLWSAAEM